MLARGALRTPGWRGRAPESRLVTGPGPAGGPAEERPPLAEVIRAGREAFAALFGHEPESVPGVEKVDDIVGPQPTQQPRRLVLKVLIGIVQIWRFRPLAEFSLGYAKYSLRRRIEQHGRDVPVLIPLRGTW